MEINLSGNNPRPSRTRVKEIDAPLTLGLALSTLYEPQELSTYEFLPLVGRFPAKYIASLVGREPNPSSSAHKLISDLWPDLDHIALYIAYHEPGKPSHYVTLKKRPDGLWRLVNRYYRKPKIRRMPGVLFSWEGQESTPVSQLSRTQYFVSIIGSQSIGDIPFYDLGLRRQLSMAVLLHKSRKSLHNSTLQLYVCDGDYKPIGKIALVPGGEDGFLKPYSFTIKSSTKTPPRINQEKLRTTLQHTSVGWRVFSEFPPPENAYPLFRDRESYIVPLIIQYILPYLPLRMRDPQRLHDPTSYFYVYLRSKKGFFPLFARQELTPEEFAAMPHIDISKRQGSPDQPILVSERILNQLQALLLLQGDSGLTDAQKDALSEFLALAKVMR